MNDFNKNEKQLYFNQIKGKITELNDGDKFCSITLSVGHENVRDVNFIVKKIAFDNIKNNFNVGEKVSVQYYPVSRKKLERWYSMNNLLDIVKEN